MRLRSCEGEKGSRLRAFCFLKSQVLVSWMVDRSLADVRKELAEGLSSMSLRVKFDLLHDESPQV